VNQQDFEQRMNGLLILCGDHRTNMLFNEELQSMINEVGLEHAMGGDVVVIAGRVGAMQGILKAQERWVEGQAERLVASGQARWVNRNEVRQ
jgi:hypothetical protein